MAYDDDYTPVLPDEEEQEKLGAVAGYPGVTPPPSPVQPAAAGYAPAGTADLESRLTVPHESMQESVAGAAPAATRPQWKDYAPAEPTTTAGKVGRFFGNMLYPYRQYEAGKEKTAEENYKNAVGEYEAPGKEAQQQATTEEAQERAGLAHAQAGALSHPKAQWRNVPTLQGPNGEPVEYNESATDPATAYRYGELPGTKQVKAPTDTQVQRKEAVDAVTAKLDKAGLPTDPKHLPHSLDVAKQQGIITPDEHAAVTSFQTTDATPSTNLTVHVQGAEATNAIKEAGKTYLYNGELVRGDKVPASADATLIKDPEQFKGEARNADIITKSFNHLVNDDHRIFDNAAARATLATALDDNQARQMGILIAGTGGNISLPAGTGKLIDQLLENHAVPENLRRDVKDYIVDYWAMKDKLLMVQMQMQGGKVGKGNQAYFAAMAAQLPGPATSDSTMARRQLKNFSETLEGLRGQYGNLPKESAAHITGSVGGGGQDYGATDKPEGSTGKLPDGTSVVVKNGRIIG